MSEDKPGDGHDLVEETETSSSRTTPTAGLTSTAYETIFNEADDAIFVFDVSHDDDEVTFTFQENNQAHESITGMTTEEYRGQTPQDFFDEEQAADVIAHYRTCVDERETIEYGETLEHPSGIVKWSTKLTPIIEDETVIQILGISRDITERKEYEEELEYYEQLIDTFDDIATVIDPKGEITFVSPSVRRVLGYNPDELVGQNGFEYQPPETAKAVQEAIEYVIKCPGESKVVQTKFRRSDGSWCWIESRIQNQLENDLIEGLVVNSRDISERKEYERKIEEQRDNLELLNQVVRHDIRNDLQVIRGRADLLEEYVDESGEVHIDAVQKSTKREVKLTKTERDLNETMLSTEADVDPVRLDQHLDSVIENARSEFDDAIITVKDPIPNSIVPGNKLLEAVFRNLVQNAVVHNDKETPQVQLSVTVADETLTVAVADNGPGIPDN
jgi:PAS domain S-box-containing protein